MIEQRRVEVRVCPAELSAAIPAKPEPGKDAMLTGNDAGMAWLGALGDWAALLLARLVDARGQC